MKDNTKKNAANPNKGICREDNNISAEYHSEDSETSAEFCREKSETSVGFYREDEITAAERIRFELICARLSANEREAGTSIGTYGEKRLHAALKNFICADAEHHEIKIGGKARGGYIADILTDGHIYEIQTGGFHPLKEKVAYYIENTDYKITVVHPMTVKKHLIWIDPADGSVSKRNPSPKKGRPSDLLPELIYLLPFIESERLSFRLIGINAEEYRIKNGYGNDGKRGSERYELIPTAIVSDITLGGKAGIAALFPKELCEEGGTYTADKFRKAMKLKSKLAPFYAAKVLLTLGITETAGKDGRKILYRLKK